MPADATIGIAASAALARLHETASRLPVETRTALYGLLARVAPAVQADLLGLVLLAEEEGFGRGVSDVDLEWRRTIAHFPGIAAGLFAVHSHVTGGGPPCEGIGGGCTLMPRDPPA